MSAKSASWVHLALLGLVNLLWAAQYPAYKVASDHLGVATLNLWTFFFATLCLLPFLAQRTKVAGPSRRRLVTNTIFGDSCCSPSQVFCHPPCCWLGGSPVPPRPMVPSCR